MRLLFLLILLMFAGCSSRRHLAGKYGIAEKSIISSVPFIPQDEYLCGPATLAMVMRYAGKKTDQKELSAKAFTPGKKGSLQADMISTVRREGLLSVPVNNLKNLLKEVNSGQPVVVLQNLGLSWYPQWHYAVVVGHDLKNSELILHSGEEKFMRMSFSTFENTWGRSDNWGILVLSPGNLSSTGAEKDFVTAAAHLEQQGFEEEALKSYESILARWERSYGALIGLGNIYYSKGNFQRAEHYLRQAVQNYPEAFMAWHNFALALSASKKNLEAKRAALRALAISKNLKRDYRQNLESLAGLP